MVVLGYCIILFILVIWIFLNVVKFNFFVCKYDFLLIVIIVREVVLNIWVFLGSVWLLLWEWCKGVCIKEDFEIMYE